MSQFPPLVDSRIIRPAESALALGLLTNLQLLRLKTLARWYARSLPPEVTWEDLMQEALTRILVGRRHVPEGVPIVAFVAGVMRSLRSEHWQRFNGVVRVRLQGKGRAGTGYRKAEVVDSGPGPDQAVLAQQELALIHALFADDPRALIILNGLAQGLTAEEIRSAAGMSHTEYDSARKRMRRVLLREGLTCTPK